MWRCSFNCRLQLNLVGAFLEQAALQPRLAVFKAKRDFVFRPHPVVVSKLLNLLFGFALVQVMSHSANFAVQ